MTTETNFNIPSEAKQHPLLEWLFITPDGGVYSQIKQKKIEPVYNANGFPVIYEELGKGTDLVRPSKARYYLADLVADTWLDDPSPYFRYMVVPEYVDGDQKNNNYKNIRWKPLVEFKNNSTSEVIWNKIPVSIIDYIDLKEYRFPSKSIASNWAADHMPSGRLPSVSYNPTGWNVLSGGRYLVIRTGFDEITPPQDVSCMRLCLVNKEDEIYTFNSITTLKHVEMMYKQYNKLFNKTVFETEMATRHGAVEFVKQVSEKVGICYVSDYLEYTAMELGRDNFEVVKIENYEPKLPF